MYVLWKILCQRPFRVIHYTSELSRKHTQSPLDIWNLDEVTVVQRQTTMPIVTLSPGQMVGNVGFQLFP